MRVKAVYIEIINRCDFNCATCYNRSGMNRDTVFISADQFMHSVALFQKMGASRFWISGGEPTLHPQFDRILDYIEGSPDLNFGIVTNGSNRNPHFIDILNRVKNLSLQISLDGSNEELNAKTRGNDHFHLAVEFAGLIRNPYQKPLLKMVISKNNLTDVKDFYDLALRLQCIPEFAFIFKSGNGCEEWEDKSVSPKEKLAVLNLIDKLNTETGIKAFVPLCTSTCPLSNPECEFSLCVKPNGDIQPCQSLYASEYTMGNLFRYNEDQILQQVHKVNRMAMQRIKTDYHCHQCLLHEECGHGCMAEAVHLTGDCLGNDGNCEFRKLQFIGYSLKKQQKGLQTHENGCK